MTRAPRWLSRLVVVGAGSAAIAAGVVPLTGGVAFAGAGDTATTLSITPTSATDTVGNCTGYKVTTDANAKFDVQISQTTTQTTNSSINFCDVTHFSQFQGANDHPVAAGTATTQTCPGTTTGTTPATQLTAQCDEQFTANSHGILEFGVTSNSAGTMNIVAYNDLNGNDQFSSNETPNAKATETWVANQASTITCAPTSQSRPVSTTADWTCNVTTSGGSGVHAATLNVYYDVNSGPDQAANPNDVACAADTSNTTGSGAGHQGVYNCSLTNGGGVGTDSLTTFVDNNNNSNFDPGEPSANESATFVNPAPNNTVVTLDCSPNEYLLNTDPASNPWSECQVPLSQHEVTFTATAKAGGVPQSGIIIDFSIDYDNTANGVTGPTPASCTTNGSGSCSTKITNAAPDAASAAGDNEWAGVDACAPTQNNPPGQVCGISEVNWSTPSPEEARNITVTPATASQSSGGAQTLQAMVTDRFNNPVGGVCVGWNETGPGRFTNAQTTEPFNCDQGGATGSYGTWCVSGPTGGCSVEVTSLSTEAGSENVTATIDNGANYDTYNSNTGSAPAQECAEPADVSFYNFGTYNGGNGFRPVGGQDLAHQNTSRGAPVGACSDSSTVSWKAPTPTSHRVVVGLHLTCFSPKKHVVKCVGQLSRPISGVTVVFRNAAGRVVGTAVTNSAGRAKIKLTGLKSGKTHRYHAHAKKSSKTFPADSNTSKVTVS